MPGLSPGGIGAIAGGVGDLFQGIFGAAGDLAEAKAYKKARDFALQNAVISQEAGDIKLAQAGRAIFKTIGAQEAGYAGAGLAESGSAQEVLRSSISQGALEKAIINAQTAINVTGYKSQAAQFQGMASAAKAAAGGSFLGGLFSAAAAIIPVVASDRRLKTDIARVGTYDTLPIYSYRFVGDDKMRLGPMADEVAIYDPDAMGPDFNGYATVDYHKLGLSSLLTYEVPA